MPAQIVVRVVVATAVAFVALVALARGSVPDNLAEWLAPIAPATLAAWLGLLAFDKWVWRFRFIPKMTGRPNLHGTWHGSLHSQWVNPRTGERIGPDDNVFIVIRQRFWSVTVQLLTKESSSGSLVADLVRTDGGVKLCYLYRNTPRDAVRDRSEIHLGAVVLEAPMDTRHGFTGSYFTDRNPSMTRGELHMTERYKTLVETHRAGVALVAGT